jgi:hypothetical protein
LLGYAADSALTFAAGALAGPDVLTAGYTINMLAPVLGDRLLARAWVISAGQRLIVTRCELIEPHPDGDRFAPSPKAPSHGPPNELAPRCWRPPAAVAGHVPALAQVLLVDGDSRDGRPLPRGLGQHVLQLGQRTCFGSNPRKARGTVALSRNAPGKPSKVEVLLHEGRQEGVEPLDRAMICRL